MFLNCGARENSWESLGDQESRRSNQSVLKEINPEYSLEGLMLKLKLQYFDHLMWRANSLEKILMLGKIECKKTRGQQRMRWLDSILDSIGMNLSKLQNIVKDGGTWHAAVHGVAKSWTQLSDWTIKEAFWVIGWTTLLEPRPYPLGKKQSHLNIGRRNVTVGHKEGWVPKNWCFKLQCWRWLLKVPWTARRANQPVLKEINPESSL